MNPKAATDEERCHNQAKCKSRREIITSRSLLAGFPPSRPLRFPKPPCPAGPGPWLRICAGSKAQRHRTSCFPQLVGTSGLGKTETKEPHMPFLTFLSGNHQGGGEFFERVRAMSCQSYELSAGPEGWGPWVLPRDNRDCSSQRQVAVFWGPSPWHSLPRNGQASLCDFHFASEPPYPTCLI